MSLGRADSSRAVRNPACDSRPFRARAPANGVTPVWLHIVFNGELYNADGLRRELMEAGQRFAGRSDTEVVLGAYDEWGPDACAHLRGMFALAVWDPRDESVLLARDPLGIKPLYYQCRPTRLAFASELRALIPMMEGPPCLSVEGLDGYLAGGALPEPHTMLQDVWMLPPGGTLRFASGEARQSSVLEPRRSVRGRAARHRCRGGERAGSARSSSAPCASSSSRTCRSASSSAEASTPRRSSAWPPRRASRRGPVVDRLRRARAGPRSAGSAPSCCCCWSATARSTRRSCSPRRDFRAAAAGGAGRDRPADDGRRQHVRRLAGSRARPV